jgi:nitrite reductase/ring-hydroxylating ferredoxin subunit/DMSO/TMAO reductase YedYZ heme-binding membrane subunit
VSASYRAVGWNRQKKIYDAVLLAIVAGYLALFVAAGALIDRNTTIETLLIRGLATAAFLLLNVILCIGPLCRLDPRLLPLLYNRRHLGVTMFLLALAHAAFAVVQFHAFGDTNPLVSVLTANPRLDSVSQFPFELLGVTALAILFLMAATSHDFWLAQLTPPVWKALHMLVYAAYGLIVLHVALGVLQSERSPLLAGLLFAAMAVVLGIHLAAARRERAIDVEDVGAQGDGYVDVCAFADIPEKRARIVTLSGERVAVFRYDGKVSAISNLCRHQNGPLGEGRIIDGCVTCPWHGYQYEPASGRAPAPFTERVPTFSVRLRGDRVLVHPRPHPPGTPVEPAVITATARAATDSREGAAVATQGRGHG